MNDFGATPSLAPAPHVGVPGGVESALLAQSKRAGEAQGPSGPTAASHRSHARQGHRYSEDGAQVIALSSGAFPWVARVLALWLGEPYQVDASKLSPLPMRYFHGEVPL